MALWADAGFGKTVVPTSWDLLGLLANAWWEAKDFRTIHGDLWATDI